MDVQAMRGWLEDYDYEYPVGHAVSDLEDVEVLDLIERVVNGYWLWDELQGGIDQFNLDWRE